MKIKLTVWTDEDGNKHYITTFHMSANMLTFLCQEIKPDGTVDLGPRIPRDQMIGGKNCKCEEIDAEISLPST